MTIAQRAAARYLKQGAGSAEDIKDNLQGFLRAYVAMMKSIQDGLDRGLSGDNRTVRSWANRPWITLMTLGDKISDGILSTRSIPAKDAKGFEMAYRLFHNSRRMPKDVYKWWHTNQKRLELTIKAAQTWKEKQEGTDELFTLGSFRIHNTVGASGADLESLKKTIEKAENLARKNPVPGFSRVLYGDIHVVSRLSQAHHAAWYNVRDDSIYLRRGSKSGMDEVRALVHELGHRYLHKNFYDKESWRNWLRHDHKAGGKSVEVELPGPGDTIPLRIRGHRGFRPTVDHVKNGQYWYRMPDDNRLESFPVNRIRSLLMKQQKASKNYPTPYSSTNAEEHFCEAMSLEAMGTLDDEHALPFNTIWN